MRNVFKGYQVGKMAVPKLHEAKINTGFAKMHAPPMAAHVRIEKPILPKTAKGMRAVGKYKG
ncbi:MAG: hypothetical protein KGI54_07005 [Pseudomonadota bacterium]|nr:hypothetical protein [Pseudomonadota bacterium]